jgi:glycosyltransferase involved in cell wall biosynthesis
VFFEASQYYLKLSLRLSIIIPVGPSRDAHTALTSLLEAGLEEGDEVILVGDGHKPVVPETLQSLPLRIADLESGSGANAARNQGVRMAVNDYLCFLDDDDAYLPDALSLLRRRLTEEVEAEAWSLGWAFQSGRSSWSQRRPEWLAEVNLRKRNLAGGCSSMVLSRGLFETAGRFDSVMQAMQDWDLWLRVARDRPIRVLAETFIIYEDTADRRISTDASRRIAGFKRILEKHGKTWSAAEVAFHEARLAAVRYSVGSVGWWEIFKWRAPLASTYFMLKSLLSYSNKHS